jgi:hypothetical protein
VLDTGVELLLKPYAPATLARKVREMLDQPGVAAPETGEKIDVFVKTADGYFTL